MENITQQLEQSKSDLQKQMAQSLRLMIQDLQISKKKLERAYIKDLLKKMHGGKNGK